jgi:integrase
MQRTITDAWLRSLKVPETGRLEVWDQQAKGLLLRVTAAGSFTWSVRARTGDGRRSRIPLGTYPETGLSAARRGARTAIGQVQSGADPVAQKRAAEAERQARKQLPTVQVRATEWLSGKADSMGARTHREYQRLVTREILPGLGHKPLSETTRADWADLIAKASKGTPAIGLQLYRVISSFLNHAEAVGWIDQQPLPRRGMRVIAPRPVSRERVLSDDELVRVWNATEKLVPKSQVLIRMLILTAAREGEVANIACGELDLEKGLWSLPGDRTKNKQGIVLPLHPIVVDGLRAVWPAHATGPGWRLLGHIKGSGMVSFSKLKMALDAESGVTGWRLHDLRRTARTGLAKLGITDDVAEACLNHVSGRSQLIRTYDRYDRAPEVLAALTRWQSHVMSLITEPPSAEIVPLQRRRRSG